MNKEELRAHRELLQRIDKSILGETKTATKSFMMQQFRQLNPQFLLTFTT